MAMAPADSSGGYGGFRQERWHQMETEAAAVADNNQPESTAAMEMAAAETAAAAAPTVAEATTEAAAECNSKPEC